MASVESERRRMEEMAVLSAVRASGQPPHEVAPTTRDIAKRTRLPEYDAYRALRRLANRRRVDYAMAPGGYPFYTWRETRRGPTREVKP